MLDGDAGPYYCDVVPSRKRGVAQRHETWGGMRWTRVALKTRALACGRRSRVVLTPRRWCQVRAMGARMTVAKTPGAPGRARYTPLKPLRGECRVVPVYPTNASAMIEQSAHAAIGRIGRP